LLAKFSEIGDALSLHIISYLLTLLRLRFVRWFFFSLQVKYY